jgi:hypothetical protein
VLVLVMSVLWVPVLAGKCCCTWFRWHRFVFVWGMGCLQWGTWYIVARIHSTNSSRSRVRMEAEWG